jgi:hypothetical protein
VSHYNAILPRHEFELKSVFFFTIQVNFFLNYSTDVKIKFLIFFCYKKVAAHQHFHSHLIFIKKLKCSASHQF